MADGSAGALYPEWTGADPAAGDWNTCILGDAIVPGIVSVDDLEVGIDIDTKKARGAECPTSTDNGLRPTKFKLRVWLNTSMWQEWQSAVQSFQPRRPGRSRQPLQIIHPLVNHLGITQVRVAGIKTSSPTAKNGLTFHILLEEWFNKPKQVDKSKSQDPLDAQKVRDTRNSGIIANGLDQARRHALDAAHDQADRDMQSEDLDPTTGLPVKPSQNIGDNIFGTNGVNPKFSRSSTPGFSF